MRIGVRPIVSVALCVLVVALYLPGWRLLWAEWLELDTYAHGFLVAALCACLVVRSGRQLLTLTPSPSAAALIYPAVLSLVWVVALHYRVEVAAELLLPFLVLAWTYAIAGKQIARELAPAALFLLFAIPFWEYLAPPLQLITANAAGLIVYALGIPVSVSHAQISIPVGVFEVDQGCSGIRFLLSAAALVTFLGFWERWGRAYYLKKLLLVASLAVVANWIRVALIVIIGQLTSMSAPIVSDHNVLGWVIFTVLVLPAFVFIKDTPGPRLWGSSAGKSLG